MGFFDMYRLVNEHFMLTDILIVHILTADLLTVISERIYQALNISGEARAVALDISKAFDKIWHVGLLRKLQAHGVSLELPKNIISSFLDNRKIKVVLDGQSSSCYSINAGVHQGSVLGPTLFLLFINDLPDHILCKLAIYADAVSYTHLTLPTILLV